MFRVVLNGEKYIAILNGERVNFEHFDPTNLSFLKSIASMGVAIHEVTKSKHTFDSLNYFAEQSLMFGCAVYDGAKEVHSFVSKQDQN